MKRLQARWDRGFWFTKALDAHKSPTVENAAAAAAAAGAKLNNGGNGA
jgi:hypothetical protein